MSRNCSWICKPSAGFPNITPVDFVGQKCICASDRTGLPDVVGSYNCIAYAAGITNRWWWPSEDKRHYDWPEHLPRRPVGEETIEDFISAFESLGYKKCGSGKIEQTHEKVAIFAQGNGLPSHACRSVPEGVWVSKLGRMEDIIHATLEMVEGKAYGKAVAFLERPYSAHAEPNSDVR